MDTLKTLRIERHITQVQAAGIAGISLRSYKTYENDESKIGSIKYEYIYKLIEEYNKVDEDHGIYTMDEIKKKCEPIFKKYNIEFAYLFGSYSKGKAKDTSDVDLLVSCSITGLKFYGMVEDIRTTLHKRVDVLDINQLKNNLDLTIEILKDGIKIYG